MATATHVGPILVSGLGIQGPATTGAALPDTLLLTNNFGTGYITGCGPSPGVNGEIIFQTDTSNGANPQRVLALEGNGWGIFYGDLSIAAGQLRLGLRSRGGWDSGTTNINSDGASLFLNATTAAGGSIFLNWDQGTGGVLFGDGFGNQVGHIDESGNLIFAGSLQVGGGITGPVQINGDLTINGDLEAERGDYTSLFVNGSQVLTSAELPPAGIPYPPPGVGVSTGTAWAASINPADLPRLSTPNTFTAAQTINGAITVAGGANLNGGVAASIYYLTTTTPSSTWNSDSVSTFIDSGGTGRLLLNYNHNPGGIGFGNDGAGTPVVSFDPWGDATFKGAITAGSGHILIGDRTGGNQVGPCNINASIGDLFLNAAAGAGKVYFNWDQGTGGVIFGNGATAQVGSIDNTGNATFNGTISACNGNISLSYPGSARVAASTGNILLDAGGANAILFNYFTGTGGVVFCDGASNSVGNVDAAGNARFHGVVTAVGPYNYQQGCSVLAYDTVPNVVQLIGRSNNAATGSPASIHLIGINADTGRNWTYIDCKDDGTGNASTTVNGAFAVTGPKSFKIPHPLDETKDLYHSCLEGPENGVYYRGEVATKKGKAEVKLPDYFEALTFDEDRSILLTQICESGDEQYAMLMATRVIGGRFQILSSVPSVKIVWEVKAVRRIGVDRLAVVRDRFVHPKKEAAHESERSREEGSRTRSRTSSTHRA